MPEVEHVGVLPGPDLKPVEVNPLADRYAETTTRGGEMQVSCTRCGACVADTVVHDRWHTAQETALLKQAAKP